MKLDDIKSYLTIFKSPEQTTVLKRKGQFALSQTQVLEYYYTCLDLELFIETYEGPEELENGTLFALMGLMQKRWRRIDGTNSAYYCDPTNPANILYSKLALELENQTGISRHQFLMPHVVGRERRDDLALDDEPKIQFLYTTENESDLFKAILSDPNARHLLTLVKFLRLFRELSQENEHDFIIALLDLGEQGEKHLHKFIHSFESLGEVFFVLNEAEKFRLLSSTGILNKLLKPKNKKRKPEYIEELLDLLSVFGNKRDVLALVDGNILDIYKRFNEIKTHLPPEFEIALASSSDDTPVLVTPTAPVVTRARPVIDLLSDESEEEERDAHDEAAFDEITPTLSVSDSTGGRMDTIPLVAEMPQETEMVEEPPAKRARTESAEQPQLFASAPPVITPPVSAPSVSLASSSVPTLFNPSARVQPPTLPIDLYRESLRKISEQLTQSKPLEALYYIRQAYDNLLLNRYHPEWARFEKDKLRKQCARAIHIIHDNARWAVCFNYYETRIETSRLITWCNSAEAIAKELLGKSIYLSDIQLFQHFEKALATLRRYHPNFPTVGR